MIDLARQLEVQNRATRFIKLLSLGRPWLTAAKESGVLLSSCDTAEGFFVYVLCDPDTWEPFYVGKGSSEWRPHNHIQAARRLLDQDTAKLRAIRAILATGAEPLIQCVVDNLTHNRALRLEGRLILALGDTLTNVARPNPETWGPDAAVTLANMIPYRKWLRARPRPPLDRLAYKMTARTCVGLIQAWETGIWTVPRGCNVIPTP